MELEEAEAVAEHASSVGKKVTCLESVQSSSHSLAVEEAEEEEMLDKLHL